MYENKSEVARLRQQLESECEAIRRMFDEPAIVASHAIIQARYLNLEQHRSALEQHIGTEKALDTLIETYQRVIG